MPRVAQREEQQVESPPLHMRVSKSYGRMMIAVGIFFDLLPFLSVLLMLIFVMMGVATLIGLDSIKSCASVSEKWWRIGDGIRCGWMLGKVFVTGAATIGSLVIMGSTLYSIVSWISTAIAYTLFTVWFWVKGVRIWSFSRASRILVNMMTIIIEMIPLLDLLPGTTVMVWRHVKVSQTEDKAKHKALVKKSLRVVRGGGRRALPKAA